MVWCTLTTVWYHSKILERGQHTWIETVGMLLCSASPTLSVAVEEVMVVLQGSGISLERVSLWLIQIVLVLQLSSLEVEVPVQSSSIT